MPLFTMTFTMDNAAFEEAPASEIARILRDTADRVEQGDLVPLTIRDANGNTIGKAEIIQ